MSDVSSKSFFDQLHREVQISFLPKRIISVVPSQTELLFDLGLEDEVIAITKFCVHPEKWFRTKTRVGGTKQLHLDQIISLQPDLIIANKEENVEEQVNELAKHFPVWISNIKTLEDAYSMITSIGQLVNRKERAAELIEQIKLAMDGLRLSKTNRSCCYLIWNEPLMTIGSDTFINTMLEVAGFKNIFADQTRYPEISVEELQRINPEFILLSSEPFPFKQKHADELQRELSNSKIIFVDGEMFSWYGSRLLRAPEYFQQLQNQMR